METVTAQGASGAIHTLQAFTEGATWHAVPAIYMFASRGLGKWKVHYIGECESAKDRLPCHERWDDAKRLGATHILACVMAGSADDRKAAERDLILWHNPPLNTHHRPQGLLGGMAG